MLFASRKEIEQFALENRLEFVEDSSNTSLKYARNRIRNKIIPEFEKLNPSFREEMRITIQKLKDAESIYNSIIEKEKPRLLIRHDESYKIPIAELKKLNPGRTWLYELLSDFNFPSSVIQDILGSLDEQPGKIFYSPTHRLVKDREFLFISPDLEVDANRQYEIFPNPEEKLPIRLELNVVTGALEDLKTNANTIFLAYDNLKFPLTIRKWQKGDYFFPFGMKNKKKLSDFFIDLKFSLVQKENTWLLCSGEDIAWIIGVRPDDRFRVTDSTIKILQIRLIS
jgi:tRNA(Ile)-lysidine synthase